jgi:hypothetical protein
MIFRNHPGLLDFFFEKKEPRIRMRAIEMRKAAFGMSSGEQLLLRVALDVWSGSGNAKIWQLINPTLERPNMKIFNEAVPVGNTCFIHFMISG